MGGWRAQWATGGKKALCGRLLNHVIMNYLEASFCTPAASLWVDVFPVLINHRYYVVSPFVSVTTLEPSRNPVRDYVVRTSTWLHRSDEGSGG